MGFVMMGIGKEGAGEVAFAYESHVILGKVPAGPLPQSARRTTVRCGGGFVALCGPPSHASVVLYSTHLTDEANQHTDKSYFTIEK